MGRNFQKLEFFPRPPQFLIEYFVDPPPAVKKHKYSILMFTGSCFGSLNRVKSMLLDCMISRRTLQIK